MEVENPQRCEYRFKLTDKEYHDVVKFLRQQHKFKKDKIKWSQLERIETDRVCDIVLDVLGCKSMGFKKLFDACKPRIIEGRNRNWLHQSDFHKELAYLLRDGILVHDRSKGYSLGTLPKARILGLKVI